VFALRAVSHHPKQNHTHARNRCARNARHMGSDCLFKITPMPRPMESSTDSPRQTQRHMSNRLRLPSFSAMAYPWKNAKQRD